MRDHRLKRIADWTVWLGLPAAVFLVVLAVFFSEHVDILYEVSLRSPTSATRGERLPIRAMVLTDLRAPAGPRIASLPIVVRLRGPDGTVLVEQRLDASPAGGVEGVVRVPVDAPSPLTLRAIARRDGEGVASASRTFDLDAPSTAPALVGRIAHATAHFDEGTVEIIDGQIPPSILAPRVVGGACAPESSCEVLVHVGSPAALVRVAPSPAITVEETPSAPTAGLARIALVVHGPDAHVTLEAIRGGEVVARRSLRLPVALATPGLAIEDRLRVPPHPTLRAAVVGEPAGVIVDAYTEGRWSGTASVEPGAEPFEVPLELRGARSGLWRLQVRTDPYSSRRAASRIVLEAGSDLDAALEVLERAAGASSEAETPEGPDALRFAWAAAGVEMGHYEIPAAARGYEQDRSALEARRSTLRMVALVAMLLGLLVLALVLVRRGIGAAREAQRVMEATGDPALASASYRRRTLLSALLIVATMLLAFVAAGALIVVRTHLLE